MQIPYTGIGTYTYELIKALLDIDKENNYFLYYNSSKDSSKKIPFFRQGNVQIINTRWSNKIFACTQKLFNHPCVDRMIEKQMNTKNTHRHLDIFFSPNINFSAISKKTKHILTIHDLSFELYPHFYTTKQRLWHKAINPKKQCQKADTIIAPSHCTKQDLVNKYNIDPKKIKVVYSGITPCKPMLDHYHPKLDSESSSLPNTKYILFLGTVEPRKNIISLIEAYEKAYPKLDSHYSLVIAGAKGWKNKNIYARAAASPQKNNIKFVGYIDENTKIKLYKNAELFVYPSVCEGFGFPILEAMQQNTPVITSNRSSLAEIAQNAAFLVNPNDIYRISEAMVQLLNNEYLSKYYIEKGKKRIEQFSWNKTANEFLQLCKCK